MDVLTYRSLRDEVYGKLKSHLWDEEALQRGLKFNKSISSMKWDQGSAMCSFYAKEAGAQAQKLTKLYEIIRFLKYGLRKDTTRAEEYFNEIFAKHKNFRNDFWTFWNAKFNKEQAK